jgi:hypothetical protein
MTWQSRHDFVTTLNALAVWSSPFIACMWCRTDVFFAGRGTEQTVLRPAKLLIVLNPDTSGLIVRLMRLVTRQRCPT